MSFIICRTPTQQAASRDHQASPDLATRAHAGCLQLESRRRIDARLQDPSPKQQLLAAAFEGRASSARLPNNDHTVHLDDHAHIRLAADQGGAMLPREVLMRTAVHRHKFAKQPQERRAGGREKERWEGNVYEDEMCAGWICPRHRCRLGVSGSVRELYGGPHFPPTHSGNSR